MPCCILHTAWGWCGCINVLQQVSLALSVCDLVVERWCPASCSGASKKRRVGNAIAAREQEKKDAEQRRKQQVQARLAAETKGKQRMGGSRAGSGTLGGLRSGGGLSALGHFGRKADEPASPSRFRPLSPTRGSKQ